MWIQISSGKGPDECELAVSLFLKSYINECEGKGLKTDVIEAEPRKITGNFKSVLLKIEKSERNGLLLDCQSQDNLISGTVQWICKSPYRPNHKRKNWFINIEVFEESEKLSFSEKDVKFESMRSSGPGGQNVNKVETAIRALHLPTGLTVTASEERSQYMNKKLAIARLSSLIKSMNEEASSSSKKTLWTQHNTLERGNPVRVYEGEKFKIRRSDIL